MPAMRSLLFVPANRPNMVARAHQTPADVIVLDLEDSVPPEEKEAARSAVAEAVTSLKAAGKAVHVRVNHLDTGLTRDDLEAAVAPGLDGLVFPKAGGAQEVRELDVLIRERETQGRLHPGDILLVPHIESARGLLRCEEIALASSRIAALSLGGEDYVGDLGVPRTQEALEYGRRVLVNCCTAYGLPPLDVVYPVLHDIDGLQAEALYARAIGFKGKYVIHPEQVEPVNAAFLPTAAEIESARRIVAAFEQAVAGGRASVQVDGRMVDTPVARRARALLDATLT